MQRNTSIMLMGLLVIISILGTFYLYDSLPNEVPSHWNASGEIDSYAPKFFGTILLPIIEIGVALLFVVIPLIEPNKKNLAKFIKQYNIFAVVMIGFLAYIHYLTLFAAFRPETNITLYFAPAIGIMFYFIGVMLNHAQQNYTVGIRTPWTLSSKKNWKLVHKRGAILFKISGIIAFLGLFFANYLIWLMIAPIILSVIYLFIYSYFEYSKEKK